MGRRSWIGALLLAAGCAGAEQALVKPSAVDPGLAELDGKAGQGLAYPVVAIDRFDGFLGEAARVEATIRLAGRLGGELRAEVVAIAVDREVPRAKDRPWTALARELAERDDLTVEERERLKRAAGPLAVVLPHLGTLSPRVERLLSEGGALFDGAHEELTFAEQQRLAPALDALNVSLARLRETRERAPLLAAELGIGLGELARLEAEPREVRAAARAAEPREGDGS